MATLSAAQRDAIAKVFDQLSIEEAFAKLAAHPDLKQTDLPPLEKRTLATLGADRRATQAFVAGLLSESASVRRMARKYSSKLSPHGAGAMLLLLAECVRPFRKLARPEDGLAGDFGGWATPLGRSVLEAKLSFEVKNPTVAVYSPATKLLKETLENLAEAVAMSDDATLIRAFEYLVALARPFARVAETAALPDDTGGAAKGCTPLYYAGTMHPILKQAIYERTKKENANVLAAFDRWARHDLTLDDEAPAGTPEAALRARYRELLPEADRKLSAAVLPISAADFLHGLSKEKAVALYWKIEQGPKPPTDAHEWLKKGVLARFKRDHPLETETPPAATPAPAKPAASSATAEAAPLFAPHLGPPVAIYTPLVALAEHYGLRALWLELVEEAEFSWLEEKDAPAAKEAPAVLAMIEAIRKTVREGTKKDAARDKVAKAIFGSFSEAEGDYLPEEVLESAPWTDALVEHIAPLKNGAAILACALYLLPPRLVAKHADLWREAASRLDDRGEEGVQRGLAVVLASRAPSLAAVAAPLIERRAARWALHHDNWTSFGLALLYQGQGPEGRAAVARAVALAKLPDAKNYYRAHFATASYQALFRKAWERRDADFLGGAFARLAVPLYFKGKKALVPFSEKVAPENYAPNEGAAPPGLELPLAQVAAFVAKERPEAMRECVKNAGEAASFEKGARALLDVSPEAGTVEALPAPADSKRIADVVALLEAPKDPAVKSGLEMLLPLVEQLGEQLDAVFRGVERAVASASPGVVQAAAALLGALATAHEARRADALALLEECLRSKNVPTAEEALRALARVLAAPSKTKGKKKTAAAKGAKKPTLSAAAKKRIAELAKEEPKRLGKLAKALLA